MESSTSTDPVRVKALGDEMAKNPFDIKTGGGVLKKVVVILVVLAVLALVINHPHDAAGIVNTAKGKGGGIVDSVAQFFRDLGNG